MTAPASGTEVVIVTGLSGAGKTTALRALEDVGYFCIDNLPIVLLPRLLELGAHTTETVERIALVVDAREADFLPETPQVLDAARESGHAVRMLFLDCGDTELLRRFSETRRRHPLAESGSVEAGIAAERAALRELREIADEVVDTTRLSVHELKAVVQDRFSPAGSAGGPSVTVLSFGFKHGLPPQADLVLDCRFLPNPHFEPALRPLTGLDAEVAAFVLDRDDTRAFLEQVEGLLVWLMPRYAEERKAHLTVAVGCTGGRHRSPALAVHIAKALASQGVPAAVRHRDLGV